MLHYSVACNENGTGRMEGWLKQSVAKVVAKTLSKEDLSWPVIRTTRCFQNFAFTEFRMFVFLFCIFRIVYRIWRNYATFGVTKFRLIFKGVNIFKMVSIFKQFSTDDIWRYTEFRTRTYTEFCRGISRYCTVKNFAELREIKSIPYKIPYSAEFQKDTSENTLRTTSDDLSTLYLQETFFSVSTVM